MIMPLRVTLTQRNCELGHLGSVNALMRVGVSVSGTLPLLAAPMLADAFGVQAVLVSAAALVALTGAALAAAARRVRTRARTCRPPPHCYRTDTIAPARA